MKNAPLLFFIFILSCSQSDNIYTLPDGGIIETSLAQYAENETRTIVIKLISTTEALKDKDFSKALMDDMNLYANKHCGGSGKYHIKSKVFDKVKVYPVENKNTAFKYGHQLESEIECK